MSKKSETVDDNEVDDTQVLELSTVLRTASKADLAVDGVPYFYAQRSSWGLLPRAEFKRRVTRMEELEEIKRPTKINDKEYDKQSAALMRLLVPDLPDDVIEGLDVEKRGAILVSFLAAVGVQAQRAAKITGKVLTAMT